MCANVDYRFALDSLSHDYMRLLLVEHYLIEKLANFIMSVYGQANIVVKGPMQWSSATEVRIAGECLNPIIVICAQDSVFAR